MLQIGLAVSGLAGLVAAHAGDWRTYAEAAVFMAWCGGWLVAVYDFGKDDRF